MKKQILGLVLCTLLASAATSHAGAFDFGGKEKKAREAKEAQLQAAAKKSQDSYKDLEQKYKDLEIDRNNVLAQTKQMLADHTRMTELEEKQATFEKGAETLMAQKDRLLSENQRLKKELASIVENHDRLKENFQEIQIRENTESQEVKTLREQLVRRVEASPQFMLVQNESRAVKQENEDLKQTIAGLDTKLKRALEYARKIQDRDLKYVQQLNMLKGTATQLKDQNVSLVQTNRGLNQTVDETPGRVKDLAKQNDKLIKETCAMHYNMGVLFTENEKFEQAANEFERALEIDPNDEKSHYNLGYLYAEQFDKPEDASKHFKRFLELAPSSKQAEAVKSYLLIRHTYQGKSLEKGSGNPF